MERLVFTESLDIDSVPFTTSDIVAEFSKNSRESIMRLIRKYAEDLQEFGKVGFEIRAMPSGQKSKIYHLNKEQATLLITYLDNTAPVRHFKRELVRQFFAMESELYARRAERQVGKSVHHSLTDAIKESGLSSHFYKHFTDLAYKSALGYTAKQLRVARGVGKSRSPLDFLSIDELMAVNEREQQIEMLITLGMEYSMIKELVNRKGIIYQTTLQMPAKSTVGA